MHKKFNQAHPTTLYNFSSSILTVAEKICIPLSARSRFLCVKWNSGIFWRKVSADQWSGLSNAIVVTFRWAFHKCKVWSRCVCASSCILLSLFSHSGIELKWMNDGKTTVDKKTCMRSNVAKMNFAHFTLKMCTSAHTHTMGCETTVDRKHQNDSHVHWRETEQNNASAPCPLVPAPMKFSFFFHLKV